MTPWTKPTLGRGILAVLDGKERAVLQITCDADSGGFTLSEEAQRILRDQTINEDRPGTILRDVETLLNFVGDQTLATSGKHLFFPQSKLDELNAMTSHPALHRLKRPQQRSFPNLDGLHLVLRRSGLLAGASGAGELAVQEELLQSWRDLNPAERYFALLESWLVRGSPEVLGERCRWGDDCFGSLANVAQQLSQHRIVEDQLCRNVFYSSTTSVTGALMEMFGWVKLEYAKPAAGEGVRIASVERLPLGDAMVSALYIYLGLKPLARGGGQSERPGVLQPLFQDYFPEYQRTLAQPERAFRDGAYALRISVARAWRRIIAPADLSLETLAMAILDSVDFDDDHLYCFELRGSTGRMMRVACPYESNAAHFADEVALGDLPLPVGGSMTMVFDYGDNWCFNIKLEKVEPPDAALEGPRIIAKGGSPPRQYEWDDEDS